MIILILREVIYLECSNCGVEVPVGKTVCPSCNSLVASGEKQLKLGSPVRRLFAYFIDYGLAIFLPFLLFTGEAWVAVVYLIYIVLEIIMMFKSTSLGKSMLGLKVVDKQGVPVGFIKMVLRETFGKIISGLVFSLGYIWILIDEDNQAWHDKFINSIVVKKN